MYSYSPFLRVTPPAGAAIVYDLGAIDRMTVAQWIPEPVFNAKETVRRRRKNIRYGWRLRAVFAWFVEAGSAGENTLVDIGYAINRNGYGLELSMDAGVTYRAVELEDWPPRTNIEEKNVAAIYRGEFVCVDLLSEDSLPPEARQAPPGIAGWA